MSSQVSLPTQLDTILAHTRQVVAHAYASADIRALERRAAEHRPRGFQAALHSAAATGPAIIAELKKASPSRGLIRPNFEPAALAASLQAAGAAALSILTDAEFFQGSLANLERASAAVTIPCLRKDFMVDCFQVLEARASGADAILLIVAAHTDATLRTLAAEAQRFELDILCEVHDRAELDRAAALGFTLIGVNSRNLRTMQVLPEVQAELAAWMPRDALRVAESGIRTHADLARLQRLGYQAFLVGESLMRQPDPAEALRTLLSAHPLPIA